MNIDKIINSLTKLGLKKGDRVFLLSSNRIEWVEFDIAIMSVGGITVPAFVTNNLDDNAFIIKNSSPKIIIFENDNILKKNQAILENFDLSKILTIEKHDGFLVGSLLLAMKIGSDIYIEGKLSPKLYYNLTNYLDFQL